MSTEGFSVTVRIICYTLIVVVTTVPSFKEFCKEIFICLMCIMCFNVFDFCNQFLFSSVGLYSASMKASMMSFIRRPPVIIPPKPITFAFNSSFAYIADVISRTNAERTPGTLLTALLMPTPVPQIHTPKSA